MTIDTPEVSARSAAQSTAQIALSSGYIFIAGLLATVLTTAASLIVVRVLTPADYGVVSYFIRVVGLLRFISSVGLGVKVIEDMARARAMQDDLQLGRTTYSLGVVRLFTTGLPSLVTLLLYLINHDPVFAWSALACLFTSLFDYLNSLAQGLQKRRGVAILNFIQPAVFLGGIMLWNAVGQLQPEAVYIVFMASFGIVALGYLPSLFGGIPLFRLAHLSWEYLRPTLATIARLFVSGIFQQLFFAIGTIILAQRDLFSTSGYFNAAFSLVTMPSAISMLVATSVFYPELVSLVAQHKLPQAALLVDRFSRSAMLLLALPMAGGLIYADVIIRTIYTTKYDASILPLVITAPLIALLFHQQLLTFSLFAVKQVNTVSRILGLQVAVVAVGTIASIFALPESALPVGLAAAYAAAVLIAIVGMHREVRQQLPIRLPLLDIFKVMLLALLTTLITRELLQLVVEITFGTALLGGLFSAILFGAAIWLWYLSAEERALVLRIGRGLGQRIGVQ